MTVRLDVRPRPTLALGAPKLGRAAPTSRVSGWLGAYWLGGVALAGLLYFDAIPIHQLLRWRPSSPSPTAPEQVADGPAPQLRDGWLAAEPAPDGVERVGITEQLAFSRGAYRGVHYGGGEDPSVSEPVGGGDEALALLEPELAVTDPRAEEVGPTNARPDVLDARSGPSLSRARSRRSSATRGRARRSNRPVRGASDSGASEPVAVARLEHDLPFPDPLAPGSESADSPTSEPLDAEQARIAALSRAVDSALGRTRPREDGPGPSGDAPAARGGGQGWHRASSGPSCEGVMATYREEVRIGEDRGPADVSREQYARVLNRGSYFRHCGAPASMGVRICAAVRDGRAEGVTVWTDPASSGVGSCVAAAVRGLGFPSSPRLDVTTTTFAPSR